MSIVEELYLLTKALYEEVQKELIKEEREAQVEQITKLLNERQCLMTELKPPYSEEEKKLGLEIVRLNNHIDKQLQRIFTSIKTDIKQVKIKKEKSTIYSDPYESISMDGVFFDKRK